MEIAALFGLVANGNSFTTVYLRPNISVINGAQTVNSGVYNISDNCETTNCINTINEAAKDLNTNIENSKETNPSSDDECSSGESINCDNNKVDDKGDKEEDSSKQISTIQRIRHSKEEYRCTLCPYTCTTEKAYIRHLRLCESKESIPQKLPLSCPICGKDRAGKQILALHMEKHKDNKHFCCDICSFRTIQLKKLIQHRRMHTGEKPHLCPFCSYRSSRRDNLRSHVRRVHKQNNLPCDTFSPRNMILSPSTKK